MIGKYCQVVLVNKSRFTGSFFTYKLRENLRDGSVQIGSCIDVPFGKGNKTMRAFVFDISDDTDVEDDKLKEVIGISSEPAISHEAISTIKWMRGRFGINYWDGIGCFSRPAPRKMAGIEEVFEPFTEFDSLGEKKISLTEEQEYAFSEIAKSIDSGRHQTFLIHGVTGSGKTEVYMEAAAEAVSQGKSAIILLPEIALTHQIIKRFEKRFGKDLVAVIHSKLTAAARRKEWDKVNSGHSPIVIGARSGIFAPIKNLGLVVIDEEHESSYKSEQSPRYETMDIAIKRAMHYGATVVLGSATPSVVSYNRAKEGIFRLINLKERYNGQSLPEMEVVDMTRELREGNRSPISKRLYGEIKSQLERGRQVIIFLNRRGYSSYISCRECGHTFKCPDCQISLTYHKTENRGICHYCGRQFKLPSACPNCGGNHISYEGYGTEQVEEIIKDLFEDYKVDRLDLDKGKTQKEIKSILSNFEKGKTDILIGTQMVAKGLDFANVGLVGIVGIDSTLNLPDYRASERGFQLITQSAGRAGRGKENGLVILQSDCPEDPAIYRGLTYDYEGFYEDQMVFRRLLHYPPFSQLVAIHFTDKNRGKAHALSLDYIDFIKKQGIKLISEPTNPRESFIGKARGTFRFYVILKVAKEERQKLIFATNFFYNKIFEMGEDTIITIDVNPQSLL